MAMATQTEKIRCRAENCNQVIAVRKPNGDVLPVIVSAFVDNRGRLSIRCPACRELTRFPEPRGAK